MRASRKVKPLITAYFAWVREQKLVTILSENTWEGAEIQPEPGGIPEGIPGGRRNHR